MSEQIDTTLEEWRTIAEFPNYSVSNFGRVRNHAPLKGVRIIKPCVKAHGYLAYKLSRQGGFKLFMANRLVAKAFLEPDPNPKRNEVNHKNGIKTDNRVNNLEWVTHSENARHSYRVLGRKGVSGEAQPHSKLTAANVIAIRTMLSEGTPRKCAAAYFGVSKATIYFIARGIRWRHVP